MAQTKAQLLNPLNGNLNVSGIVTSGGFKVGTGISMVGAGIKATTFYGNGSELTGITAGATLSAGSGDQRVVVTSLTSGTMTAAATDAELSYNSSTNTLSATNFSGALSGNATGLSGTPDISVGTITASGNVSVAGTLTYEDVTNVDSVGVVTARSGIRVGAGQSISPVSGTLTYFGDGSNLTGISAGISTTASTPSANTVVTLNLSTAQHHDITLTAGITTITCSGGSFGDSHSVVISQPSSGIATVGFSTFFLFPSGATPSMSEGSSKVDLVSFVVKRVGAGGTQLLASAGLNYSN